MSVVVVVFMFLLAFSSQIVLSAILYPRSCGYLCDCTLLPVLTICLVLVEFCVGF